MTETLDPMVGVGAALAEMLCAVRSRHQGVAVLRVGFTPESVAATDDPSGVLESERSQVDGEWGGVRAVGAEQHGVWFIEERRSSAAVDVTGDDPHSACAAESLPARVRHVGL
ncbi:hypothetical protein SAMN04490239_1765 [Rhodococcus koreensis]|uniref:Uncharacterized protein n=1 Tax=Rhodococcus koreensis TaxID=99653 RepID=A0A1H4MF00_9NOCA|nr:hypothetical protein SAMN04490239_1765 [Rhodococcus koreensis]